MSEKKMKTMMMSKIAVILLVAGSGMVAEAQMTGFGGAIGAGSMGMGQSSGGAGNAGDPGAGIRPWVSANGGYAETITTGTLGVLGRQTSTVSYGASAGLSGQKSWERDAVVLMGTATYGDYSRSTYKRGVSGVGGLLYSHAFTERVKFYTNATMSSTSGGYGYGAGSGSLGGLGLVGLGGFRDAAASGELSLLDPANNGLVDTEIVSTRATGVSTMAGLSFQPTLRWMFGVQGGSTMTRRDGGLSEMNSYGGGGFAGYRVTERTMVRLSYSYARVNYLKLFGGNEVQSMALGVQRQFAPNLLGYVQAGVNRVHTNSFGVVVLPADVSGLLGTSTQLTVVERTINGIGGGAGLTYSKGRAGFTLTAQRGVTPGNGLLLVSRQDSAMAGASFRLNQRASLSVTGQYSRLSEMLRSSLRAEAAGVQGSFATKVIGNLHFVMSGGYRTPIVNGTSRPAQVFASMSLAWSPGGEGFRF